MTGLLSLRGVTKTYPGPLTVLRDVTLDIGTGEDIAVVGPSGSGKTTMLSIMGTLDEPTTGQVWLDGVDVGTLPEWAKASLRAQDIGFVFQQFFLLPALTALDNVAEGLLYGGLRRSQRREAAMEALDRVGLAARAGHRPGELSGGEQQRVAIARAIAGGPRLLLADEPTGSLDQASGHQVVDYLQAIAADGTTVVVITHDHGLADRFTRRISLLDGAVVADVETPPAPAPVVERRVFRDEPEPEPEPPAPLTRARLTPLDTLATATLGPRGRPSRAVLSAVGVAIGIASLVAVLGVPACLQAEAQAQFNAWGANLLIVSPGVDARTQEVTPIPETAPSMVKRIWPVKASVTIRYVPDVSVYRSALVPVEQTQGLSAAIVEGDPLGTLSTTMESGRWFDAASTQLPTVVLGSTAAKTLGAAVGQRIWVGSSWWAVIGVVASLPGFAGQLDAAAFLAPGWAKKWWPDVPISQILVNAYPGRADAVRSVLPATVNPAKPGGVDVQLASMYGYAQDYVSGLFSALAFGLGGIALLVGGIGIANTMVVSVMERRGEIGLRRALGARTGQVGLQFVLEAMIIGLLGGLIGEVIGVYAVFCFAAYFALTFAVPAWVLAAGPGIAVLVGALGGLYPSLNAAHQTPTMALRAV